MSGEGESRLVHVHGGSVLLEHLAAAGLPGARLEWCDPVCSGPTPAGASPDEWYRVRAEHLRAVAQAADAAPIEAKLRAQDQALAAIPPDAEIAIWTGPELFCQSILMRLLAMLSQTDRPGAIAIVEAADDPAGDAETSGARAASAPARPRGCPLGRLDSEELRAAFAARRPATAAALALARRAWDAFTRPGARSLARLIAGDTSALPHLGAALRRHLDDLPDAATGLSTTESNALEVLRSGPRELRALLEALAERELRPWLTDSILSETLRRLGATEAPLVAQTGDGSWSLTRRGDDVLAGYDTWTAERWLGGIHLGVPDA